ncbi:hypothetical protein MRX96_025112 [Rhipicephalus microplus]
MIKQKRKALLFLDNCRSHMKPLQVEAIELACFPPNATSVLQSIDEGVVHSVTAAYRTCLVERLLFDMQNNRASNIDVRCPVEVLASVSQQVRDPLVWHQVREEFGADSFSDYVTFDNDVVDNEELTDEEVRATIEARSQLSSEDSDQKISHLQ